MSSYLPKLLSRGDCVSVTGGRLCIQPASGIEAPQDWLEGHSGALIHEILTALGQEAYQYESFSTGCYGDCRAGGVTLQFTSLIQRKTAYATFNADRKYVRGAKKGKLLPKGQFRVKKGFLFRRFWESTGLKLPNRLASFHDYMGNLGQLVYVGTFKHGEKFQNASLRPLSISAEQVKAAFLPDNSRTTSGQLPDNSRTTSGQYCRTTIPSKPKHTKG